MSTGTDTPHAVSEQMIVFLNELPGGSGRVEEFLIQIIQINRNLRRFRSMLRCHAEGLSVRVRSQN